MEFTDIIGVRELFATRENGQFLLEFAAEKGKVFTGYKGNYLYCSIGRAEYSFHVMKREDGKNEMVGASSHVAGNCIWHLLFDEESINTEEERSEELGKSVICRSPDADEESRVSVTLVHADVLPCYSPGEPVTMQVVAFPLKIHYYPDEEACDEVRAINAMGTKIRYANGRLFCLGHEDCVVKGIVRSVELLTTATIVDDGAEERQFYYVVIDTQFGPLPLCHAIGLVEEAEREYIKEGACVFADCMISGDVAIKEYQGGAVYDEIHDLKLLRECLETNDFSRAGHVFAEDAVYVSDNSGVRADSGAKAKALLQTIADNIKNNGTLVIKTYLVRIDEYRGTREENQKYVGHYAVAYSQHQEHEVEDFFLVETNEDGKISKLYVSGDSGLVGTPFNLLPQKEPEDFVPIILEHSVDEWLDVIQNWRFEDDETGDFAEAVVKIWGGMEPDCVYEDNTGNAPMVTMDKGEGFAAFREKVRELNGKCDGHKVNGRLMYDVGCDRIWLSVEVSERQRINRILWEKEAVK